jgi:hypothetical protein
MFQFWKNAWIDLCRRLPRLLLPLVDAPPRMAVLPMIQLE